MIGSNVGNDRVVRDRRFDDSANLGLGCDKRAPRHLLVQISSSSSPSPSSSPSCPTIFIWLTADHPVVILRLNSQHLATIKAHAERTYPEECCGLLLGKSDPTGKTVMEVRATNNAWRAEETEENHAAMTKKRRYSIAPEEMLAAMRAGRNRGITIIGIYHSHPDHSADPSECDRQAAWQQYSYAIVSVPQGKADAVRSWSLNEQSQFQAEDILIVKSTQV